MENSILWRINSSVHDWSDGHLVRALLERVSDAGLIGPVTWCQTGIKGVPKKMQLPKASELVGKLAKPLPGEPPQRYLEAGGDAPWPWSVILSISPFDEKEGEPDAPNFIWLFLAKQAFIPTSQSQEIFQAFREINNPENTEYAFIHDYEHWLSFSDQNYKIPVTTGSTFKGAYWLNFIGPGHIEEFDLEHLATITAFATELVEEKGFYARAYDNVLEAADSANEAELKQLTKAFRTAIKPSSKWKKQLK